MKLREFYESLPPMSALPNFYIRGYTEALRYYTGVRVVPDISFCEGVPSRYRFYLDSVPAPFYFVPIIRGNNCYGFLLKSMEKRTPRYCTDCYLPNYDLVRDGDTVVFVEGIKDSCLPLSLGLVTLPMCTSSVSAPLLEDLASRDCKAVYCPDNDKGRDGFVAAFRKKVSRVPIEFAVFPLSRVKDFGDWFSDDAGVRAGAEEDADCLKRLYLYMGGRLVDRP